MLGSSVKAWFSKQTHNSDAEYWRFNEVTENCGLRLFPLSLDLKVNLYGPRAPGLSRIHWNCRCELFFFVITIAMNRVVYSYQKALETLRMQSLRDRREQLCLKFAKNCLKIDKFRKFFPLNNKLHSMPTRHCEKYAAKKKSSERYAKSALPYIAEW